MDDNLNSRCVIEIDLTMPVEIFATGWRAALQRVPKIDVQSVRLTAAVPRTVTIALRQPRIRTVGFTFAEMSSWQKSDGRPQAIGPPPAAGANAGPAAVKPAAIEAGRTVGTIVGRTRVRPPTDIIKLEDRLYYLLQPPLETIFTRELLDLPFDPFAYQLQGVAFLYPRISAILADEMGLGKTMQAITAARLLLHAAEIQSVLVVCPKPLVTNWQREFAMWAPELPNLTIEGEPHRRSWQWHLPHVPVKIANYELLMRDQTIVTQPGVHFDLVILDEAQRIKNRTSSTSQVVRSVSRRRSWALTGTPVENSPDDMVGIFEFLAPGYLSSGMTPRRMRQAVSDYVLRRTKQRVLQELPPKLFRDADLELTCEQRRTYDLAESEGILRLTEMGDALTIHHVFELILRLKQICNFDPVTSASSKLERLIADLEEISSSGQKAIVFSQWVRTLAQLRRNLAHFGPLEYHGQVPTSRRDRLIQQFRSDRDAHVLLISYGAGSVGLNLQFAGYVFLFDRWWNPAVEDQAINRAHRIGVAGPVTVTRFITRGTIEDRIHQVLCEKRAMFDAILAQTDPPLALGLSQHEIFGLFNLRIPSARADRAA